MSKYQTLINILDQIRFESPREAVKYRPSLDDLEKVNQARSRALLHLFLKVNFGLLDFKSRETLVTDGTYDGGIDAYFIDKENKKIFFVQSKFRATEKNFEEKEIDLSEILKMDVDRITDGEDCDEDGNEYNGKIKQLKREITQIEDIGRYSYEVIILANLKNTKPSQLKKLTNGFSVSVYDHEKSYSELVFPVVTGTYYNNSQLCISLNLKNKNSSGSRISYNVETEFKDCDITVVFVPTEEIGRILYRYKNSILKFNPRCYLEMQSNSVNKEIYSTIKERKTNEFALFNNGITMLSDETLVNEKVGQKDKAQIIIKNPQIINGGQTAYTLSRIYDETEGKREDIKIFENKEVLLKIITFGETAAKDEAAKLKLIEDISKATNKQSTVSDADRRSNDKIQIELQKNIFESFGYYYERKKGEYADGIKEKYISRDLVIDRETLLRLAMTCDGLPAQARRTSSKRLFQEENFRKFLNSPDRHSEYFYAYSCYLSLFDLEKELSKYKDDRFGTSNFGQGVRYGKFAVVSICAKRFGSKKGSHQDARSHIMDVLNEWVSFERFSIANPLNHTYFRVYTDEESGATNQELNFEGYYKGRTLNNDIQHYFLSDRTIKNE
ncbi:AIPR family protein [Pseudomonas grimontii]|uniref:AIPR family protein n=1 Tax=Pseudomonas grimontii TaxID=129847 RepID=UPI00216A036F|nr:AIPR family protein [Pseudomonas grimontii]MCS3514348.1 hypothetical protein [Pseudomonas grimontii]